MPVVSCLVPFAQVRDAEVVTIEGLEGAHPLQKAFVELGGAQCGICTPGMIMAAVALGPNPSFEDMRRGLAGNLCRCTGYEAIYRAVEGASAGRGRVVKAAVSAMDLLEPRSLDDALRHAAAARAADAAGGVHGRVRAAAVRHAAGAALHEHLGAGRAARHRAARRRAAASARWPPTRSWQRSPIVWEHLPMLVAASREVGGVQIQNRGTIGGNIANGSPAGDSLPVLAAADAVVVLRSLKGERRVPFNEHLHRLPRHRHPPRRADRGGGGAAGGGGAVVP